MPGSVCFQNHVASNLRSATRQDQFVAVKHDKLLRQPQACLIHLPIRFSPDSIVPDLIDNQLALPLLGSIRSLVISDLKRKLVSGANIAAVAKANAGLKMIEDFHKTHKIAHSNKSAPRLHQ